MVQMSKNSVCKALTACLPWPLPTMREMLVLDAPWDIIFTLISSLLSTPNTYKRHGASFKGLENSDLSDADLCTAFRANRTLLQLRGTAPQPDECLDRSDWKWPKTFHWLWLAILSKSWRARGKWWWDLMTRCKGTYPLKYLRSPLHIADERQNRHVLLQRHLGNALKAGDQCIQLCIDEAATPKPTARACSWISLHDREVHYDGIARGFQALCALYAWLSQWQGESFAAQTLSQIFLHDANAVWLTNFLSECSPRV